MRYIHILILLSLFSCGQSQPKAPVSFSSFDTDRIISHVVDLPHQELAFYWRNEKGENHGNFKKLRSAVEAKGQSLTFAMNGGMYLKDGSPQGLFIQHGKRIKAANTRESGYGNFYLQPNGIFFLTTEKKAVITTTANFKERTDIEFATQSGPMLVIDGEMHTAFTNGSKNVHFRNGVGILPDGRLLFAISKEKINFYDFASFFLKHGCRNALYLDGFVSRMYLSEKDWIQEDGNFGVIIAETSKKQ